MSDNRCRYSLGARSAAEVEGELDEGEHDRDERDDDGDDDTCRTTRHSCIVEMTLKCRRSDVGMRSE